MLNIIVIDNGIDFQRERTFKSLEAQTDRNYSSQVVSMLEFWKSDRNRIASDGKYTLFIYSGSELDKNAVKYINEAIQRRPAEWFYFNEFAQDVGLKDIIMFSREKTASCTDNLLYDDYLNEGYIFSNELLAKMNLEYEGINFGVAVKEMAYQALDLAVGIHISEVLLKHFGRGALNSQEKKLLAKWSAACAEKHAARYACNGDADYAIIRTDSTQSIIQQIKANVLNASSEVLLFIDENSEIPDDRDCAALAAYASQENVGLVSPAIKCEKAFKYAGIFSKYAAPLEFEADRKTKMLVAESEQTREASIFAWQAFAIEVNKLKNIDWEELALKENNNRDFSVFELSECVRATGYNIVYVGSICAKWNGVKSEYDMTGFEYMLRRYGKDFLLDAYCPVKSKAVLKHSLLGDWKCYAPDTMEKYSADKKSILILSHELSLTGAPIVLVHAANLLQQSGYQLVVMSPMDGDIAREFTDLGIPVIVNSDILDSGEWINIAKTFDMVLVNTIVPFRQIEQLGRTDIPVLWWLHDARFGYEIHLKYVLPKKVSDNIHIYSVSKYAEDVVQEFRPAYPSKLLPYGLEDVSGNDYDSGEYLRKYADKKVFVSVGQILYRKGQDIMAEAIRLLDDDVRKMCQFLIVGKPVEKNIYKEVEKAAEEFPNEVTLIDAIPHDQIMGLYRDVDAVVCSSRDDPLPTYMSETMMLSGVCICSENTGTAAFINDGENGYLYHNDSPLELAECITKVVRCEDSSLIKKNARKTFEEQFTMEVFRRNLNTCVDECLASDK